MLREEISHYQLSYHRPSDCRVLTKVRSFIHKLEKIRSQKNSINGESHKVSNLLLCVHLINPVTDGKLFVSYLFTVIIIRIYDKGIR